MLATAALAGLSIQSVHREAQLRTRFITDTHRSIAEVVSARLDAAMVDADRAVAAALQSIEPRPDTLFKALESLEASQPWVQPLVVVSTSRVESEPEAFRAAEQAEYGEHSYAQAAALYSRAAAQAVSGKRRSAALNAEARTELKGGNARRAADTYRKVIVETETLDSEGARLALIARHQLAVCYRLLRRETEAADAVIDVYRFLINHRFILDQDTYDFYKNATKDAVAQLPPDSVTLLRSREQVIESVATSVRTAAATVAIIPVGSAGAQVAHPWTVVNAKTLLERSLADPGPWSGVRIILVDESDHPEGVRAPLPLARVPHWRVAALPQAGSVDALALREVIRFAVILVLVFGTVVAALFLGARSVSRELALSQLRSDFVASVSHELKTPLALIRMFAESLREGWVGDDKRAGYYEVITRESERLTGLINNVLEFSHIESGTRQYHRAMVDLGDILRGLLDRYRYHLNAAHIALIEELPADPIYAYADAEALEQVLVNLLSNAVKYMGDMDGRLRQVTVSLTSTREQAVIRVSDSGIGMADEDRVHIFERFWRARDARVLGVAGSGLGLTLVKHIVEAHDGAVAVESVRGGGSTFAVTLPLSAGEQAWTS